MKNKISNFEVFSIFVLSIVSSTIGLSLYMTIKIASIDSYIGVIIGTIIGIIPFLIFLLIFNYKKDKTIYDKNTYLFGNIFGNIINYLLTILFFVVASTLLFNLGNFIVSQYLVDTPLIYILIILGLILFYILNKGIEAISRISIIFVIIFILFFIFGSFTLTGEVKLDNLKPILEFGIYKPIIAGLINSLITTMPFFTILIIPKDNIRDKEKNTKYLIIGYIISSIILITISFLPCAILGKYLINLYQYPGYISLKKISLFKFIDRIENFLSFHWIISSIIAIVMSLYYVKSNIKKNDNNKILNIIICMLMVFLSYKLFKNNTVFNNYIYHVYPYILIGIFSIFVIASINIIIRKLLKKE